MLLIVGASRHNSINILEEVNKIKASLQSKLGDMAGYHTLKDDHWRYDSIQSMLDTELDVSEGLGMHSPRILHVASHHEILTDDQSVFQLQDRSGNTSPLTSSSLLSSLQTHPGVQVLVLNCCKTEKVAVASLQYVSIAIGTTENVPDEIARNFFAVFYSDIAVGASVGSAFENAMNTAVQEEIRRREKDISHEGNTAFAKMVEKVKGQVRGYYKMHVRTDVDPKSVFVQRIPQKGNTSGNKNTSGNSNRNNSSNRNNNNSNSSNIHYLDPKVELSSAVFANNPIFDALILLAGMNADRAKNSRRKGEDGCWEDIKNKHFCPHSHSFPTDYC